MGRASPCPRAASSHSLQALGTCTSTATLVAPELLFPLCPCVPAAVARCCCSSFRLSLVPEPLLSPAVALSCILGGSITAHVFLVAASSLCWAFAGLAWLLSRSSVGWLQALEDSPVLLIWKTLSVTTRNGDGA